MNVWLACVLCVALHLILAISPSIVTNALYTVLIHPHCGFKVSREKDSHSHFHIFEEATCLRLYRASNSGTSTFGEKSKSVR